MIYREVMRAGSLALAAVGPATIVIWWIALPEGHFLLGAPPEVSRVLIRTRVDPADFWRRC